jgi:hypothetical protein
MPEPSGSITVRVAGEAHKAEWRVSGGRVEIISPLGADSVALGALASAPATVAREALLRLVNQYTAARRVSTDRDRFNVRDA